MWLSLGGGTISAWLDSLSAVPAGTVVRSNTTRSPLPGGEPCSARRGPGSAGSEGRWVLAMRAYELMVIVDGDRDDATLAKTVDGIEAQVAAAGGEVKSRDLWGRRRFAYEIDHKWEGLYAVVEMLAPGGGSLDELERTLRIADDVVRHKLIRLPDGEAARRGLLGEATTA